MQLANVLNDSWNNVPLDIREWTTRNYKTGIQIGLIILGARLINRYSGRFFRQMFERTLRSDMYPTKNDRKKRLDTLNSIAGAVVHFGVWFVAFIIVIGLIGVNTAPLFAGAGLVGAGIAFGAQSLIKDFLSGLFIITENQYRVGDYIEVMGVGGTVESIGLRTTVLKDPNGSVHHIPNGSIVVTTNRTMGQGRINLDISVLPSSDISLLEHVINHAGQRLAENIKLKDDIIELPRFDRISDYTGSAITVKVIGKTVGGKQLKIKSALLAELKKDFDENNIKLAISQTKTTAGKTK
ncbi:MAG: mechanosensitive ion channel family protein [bacterium]